MSLLAACAPQSEQSQVNKAVLNTMIALNVQGSQTAAAAEAINQATGTAAVVPTLTLTPTVFVSPTPENVWLTIDKNTNCRIGPASVYDMVTTLMQGQKVQSVARNYENNYYYVLVPEANNAKCWVWGEYVTIEGDATPLPIFTALPSPTPSPTPTPTPNFSIEYQGLNSCGGGYNLHLLIANTGGVAWSSIRIDITDRDTHDSMTFKSNDFTGYSGCSSTGSNADLQPGEESSVNNITGDFNYDPTGHDVILTITLYSKDNYSGTLFTKEFNVTP